MKGLIVLVALGCMLGASAINLRSEAKPTELGMKASALNALKTAIQENNAKSKELSAQCGEEKSEASKWAEEGASLSRADRDKQKAALHGALAQLKEALVARINGLDKLIKRLNKMRERLRSHIRRVNAIFGLKYDLDSVDAQSTPAYLSTLGDMAVEPNNPNLDPLQTGEEGAAEVSAATGAAADAVADATGAADEVPAEAAEAKPLTIGEGSEETSPAVLLEMMSIHDAAACKAAHARITALYQAATSDITNNHVDFEKERNILRPFRLKMKTLIEKKTAKKEKLEAQLARITKQMAEMQAAMDSPEPRVADLLADTLGSHMKQIDASCDAMQKQAKHAATEKNLINDELKKCESELPSPKKAQEEAKAQATADATGAAADATGAADAAPEVDADAATGVEEPAAPIF